MNLREYEFIDPKASEAGRQLEELARNHPFAAARLIESLEEFVIADTDLADRIVTGGPVEIFFVPPRFVLRHLPDAAAIVRVDHAGRQVSILRVIEEYGGVQEQSRWDEIVVLAQQAAAARK